MAIHSRRAKVRTAVLAAVTGAVIAAAVTAALGPAVAAARPHGNPLPVVVNCAGKNQTRPSFYTLACGDGSVGLVKLHWAAWAQTEAFGNGTYAFDDCVPSCAGGHLHSFPALVALWGVKPLPGHVGTRYFTRMTLIYTGNRTYRAGGKKFRLPPTSTYPLSSFGGA